MKAKKKSRRGIVATTDPEGEAMKAARSNIDHDDAVQLVQFLQHQYLQFWSKRPKDYYIDVYQIMKTLSDKRLPFVLTGGHGFAGWTGRPRATQDVDILVRPGRNYARAVNAVSSLYPRLETKSVPPVTSFFFPGERLPVVDVFYAHRADLVETLNNPTWAENKELGLRYRIPSLEELLANKYGAMSTPTRDTTMRMQDVVDFMGMAKHSEDEGRQPLNQERLEFLGQKVWPGGGGKELLRIVALAKADKPIRFDRLRKVR